MDGGRCSGGAGETGRVERWRSALVRLGPPWSALGRCEHWSGRGRRVAAAGRAIVRPSRVSEIDDAGGSAPAARTLYSPRWLP